MLGKKVSSWQVRPLNSVLEGENCDLDVHIPYTAPGVDIGLRDWEAGLEHAGIINENLC